MGRSGFPWAKLRLPKTLKKVVRDDSPPKKTKMLWLDWLKGLVLLLVDVVFSSWWLSFNPF